MLRNQTTGFNRGGPTSAKPEGPPATLAVLPAGIPESLRSLRRWVAWRWLLTDAGKWTKPPVSPAAGRDAETDDPSTWGTFELALARMQKDGLPGVGLVMVDDDDLVAIDLDGCREPVDDDDLGHIDPAALEMVEQLDSYSEVSPTMTGLRVMARAALTLPNGKGKQKFPAPWAGRGGKGPAVEVFVDSGYVTLTGRAL